jgi:hypothetical protein
MRQASLLALLLVLISSACKPKESANTTSHSALDAKATTPEVKSSPLDKTPNVSTGWTIPPCRLVDEDDIRKQLKVNVSIAMIPEIGANAQAITSCNFRWMKLNTETIEAENKKIRDAVAKKGGGVATLLSLVDIVSVSYTGKYNDTPSATTALNEMIAKDKLKAIPLIGTAAAWNAATNQLTIQKENAIFYIVVDIDAKKNLDYAQGLAVAACARVR